MVGCGLLDQIKIKLKQASVEVQLSPSMTKKMISEIRLPFHNAGTCMSRVRKNWYPWYPGY